MNATREVCDAVSDYMRKHDAGLDMMRSNPLLYLAYYVEAAGDRRIEGDVIAPSVLTSLADMARTMVAKHEGQWTGNPLFSDDRRNSRRRGF